MSKPEPDPINKGVPVTALLIKWLGTIETNGAQAAVDLVTARDAFGRAKYGQPLMTEDGRDTVEDALQELGDLLQYTYKAKLNGEDITPIKQILPVLIELVNSV